jgi:arginyl-tRNA synthetase
MKKQILADLLAVIKALGIEASPEEMKKIEVTYPEPAMGDFSTSAALVLAKAAKTSPKELASQIIEKLDKSRFAAVEVGGPGFINFKLSNTAILESLNQKEISEEVSVEGKIIVEYFQPNIAKPLHVGHLRTAIIGDAIVRSLKYLGRHVESDTHMGDWGTQFGLLILAYKKYGNDEEIMKDPIDELNKLYVRINNEIEAYNEGLIKASGKNVNNNQTVLLNENDPELVEQISAYKDKNEDLRELGKQEFVKLESGDETNRQIWKRFVDWSMEKFLTINDLMDILPFDHHWPESFYEDKMAAVVASLKEKELLVESQGAQIVNLEAQGLGVAVVVKSDGGTTYLLRDLATFYYRKSLGFTRQLYVVDNRQSHAFRQLFAILKLLGDLSEGEAAHVDFGFMSFKGAALSTRKGNMILAQDVIAQAEEKVFHIIQEKNPDLNNKTEVVKAVSQGALKYYDLSHNRHSDIEFDWDTALDFNGNSGPYLQYTYARLSSILRKARAASHSGDIDVGVEITPTEHQLAAEAAKLPEMVEDSMRDYLPNLLANYLYNLANLANKFYHESPVASEEDKSRQAFRLALVAKTMATLKEGLGLLGIRTLEEM